MGLYYFNQFNFEIEDDFKVELILILSVICSSKIFATLSNANYNSDKPLNFSWNILERLDLKLIKSSYSGQIFEISNYVTPKFLSTFTFLVNLKKVKLRKSFVGTILMKKIISLQAINLVY